MSKVISSSFITLIPKKDCLTSLDDYMPICLVGFLYKTLSKLLVARLKKVLGNFISENKSAFVPGRNLMDGVLVANEIVDYAVKENKSFLIFKFDIEKAYDRVN